MVSVSVLARLELKPGLETEVAGFFREGLPLVEKQPATTVWFASGRATRPLFSLPIGRQPSK